MSTPLDQYRDYVEQRPQAFQTAVDYWTKTVEQTVSAVPTNPAQVDPQQGLAPPITTTAITFSR